MAKASFAADVVQRLGLHQRTGAPVVAFDQQQRVAEDRLAQQAHKRA
jgi:hypothetical protein